jgi:hypothetical protein
MTGGRGKIGSDNNGLHTAAITLQVSGLFFKNYSLRQCPEPALFISLFGMPGADFFSGFSSGHRVVNISDSSLSLILGILGLRSIFPMEEAGKWDFMGKGTGPIRR